jgi:methyl-accepting chemotaxis protein
VGIRLALAFGLLVVLIGVIVAVGVTAASNQQRAQAKIIKADDVAHDLTQKKYVAAAMNASQTAYALDVQRGTAGALDDDGGNRRQFLDDTKKMSAADSTLEGHRLGGAEVDLEKAFDADFERVVKNDADIVALYRSGGAEDAATATALVLGEERTLFQDMAQQSDALAALVEVDAVAIETAEAAAVANARNVMAAVGLAAMALAVGLAVVITRSLTRPLRESVDVLQAMADGDLSVRVVDPSKDEVGQIGTAMNHSLDRISLTLEHIADGSTSLSSSSEELSAVSLQLSAGAEETAAQAATVSAAAEQVSHNVQSVAAGAEQLGASIQEIARNTGDAALVANEAVAMADATNETVVKLGASSLEIGEVVRVIGAIAQQTNLLALNATIEAARAGEAGKGFAVVANEVKDLARKTARSSDEIGRKVESIQVDTRQAVLAIDRIGAIIRQINEIQTVVAAAVEEQSATTKEISRSVSEAATGSTEIARNIIGVADGTQGVTQGAAETHRAADDLSRLANDLLGLVAQFRLRAEGPAMLVPAAVPVVATPAGLRSTGLPAPVALPPGPNGHAVLSDVGVGR